METECLEIDWTKFKEIKCDVLDLIATETTVRNKRNHGLSRKYVKKSFEENMG